MPIVNRFIPLRAFAAVNLFGFIFVRRGNKFTTDDLRHELIHTRQMRELLYVPFYIVYGIEWLVRLIQFRSPLRAYLNISFEREAYANQWDEHYLEHRRPYSWTKYLRSKKGVS